VEILNTDRGGLGVQDPGDRPAIFDGTAVGLQPAQQRRRELARTPGRDRKTDALPQHGQQPSEDGTAGLLGPAVRVQRTAGHQQLCALAMEVFPPVVTHRLHRQPGEPQGLRCAEGA
jgi:hypothetical protein